MRGKVWLLPLLLLLLVGCSAGSNERSETTTTPSATNLTYDPQKVKVGDQLGLMTIKSAQVTPFMENQPLVDIEFTSEPIEISGTYHHDPDRDGITFIPDSSSQQLFPKHNLFEYETRLYFTEEKDASLFGNQETGEATIEIEGYHEIVNYKDEVTQNSRLIRMKDIH
ncbi:hypothetical protein DFQ01_12070 [Paenibacillus cellulosilyticus]|uniref:Uncharacterized protein n=1 Tax=Paenibacillus cellulosilyticus TaxID=375489 RepID=A0A2V2YPD2_9BACL|nr:hypothetical protein [Paenibacillus cellulosilyticus]PWV97883.1 hypothetical protein DFQ01_12070 [Paenibacillus cellulosilyticus]QKS46946.1 hypothetical protein HUB94_20965 [Paenibacillus cellulosilyticus]